MSTLNSNSNEEITTQNNNSYINLPTSRINRCTYGALNIIGLIIFYILIYPSDYIPKVLAICYLIALIILYVLWFIQLNVKRLHDIGISGYAFLLSLIPGIGLILGLLLFFVPGSKEKNKYGDVPKPASSGYKLLYSVWVLLMVFLVFIAIFYHPKNKTYNYETKFFSIDLPCQYKTKYMTLYDVPFTDNSCQEGDAAFRVDRVDLQSITPTRIETFSQEMGLGSDLSNLFKFPGESVLSNILIDDKEATDIKIIDDKLLNAHEMPGRLLKGEFKYRGKVIIIKAMLFLDNKDKQLYSICAYYYQLFANANERLVDQFFNSLEFYPSKKNKILEVPKLLETKFNKEKIIHKMRGFLRTPSSYLQNDKLTIKPIRTE